MNKYRIDVNIVDDHTMFCEGLENAINNNETIHVSHTFNTLEACRLALQERRPDVLLVDISMPDGDGESFCQLMLETYPKMKIVCLTIHDEYAVIRRMLDSGVHGYLLKSSPVTELIEAIQTVWKGESYFSQEVKDIIDKSGQEELSLTIVECNILRLICDGHTNPEIADQLCLSKETINWYRKRLLAKFGVKNTVGLVKRALNEKLL